VRYLTVLMPMFVHRQRIVARLGTRGVGGVWCGGAEPWADEPLGRLADAGRQASHDRRWWQRCQPPLGSWPVGAASGHGVAGR